MKSTLASMQSRRWRRDVEMGTSGGYFTGSCCTTCDTMEYTVGGISSAGVQEKAQGCGDGHTDQVPMGALTRRLPTGSFVWMMEEKNTLLAHFVWMMEEENTKDRTLLHDTRGSTQGRDAVRQTLKTWKSLYNKSM